MALTGKGIKDGMWPPEFAESYSLGLHTGEDWNGSGGGDTDLGQPVRAIANGKVVYAQEAAAPFGKIVVIEHCYLENGKPMKVFSQYDHFQELKVVKDQVVKRRDQIGTIGKGAEDAFPAHLHFEIRKESMATFSPEFWPSSNGWTEEMVRQNYEEPTAFLKAHRKLLHPASAPLVVLAVKHRHQMFVIKKGVVDRTHEMALSQQPLGAKWAEGDLKTPEGEYRVLGQSLGPFDDEGWRRFLGAAWIRLDYPNGFDARLAFAEGRITQAVRDKIVAARPRGAMPPQDTPLGGGIGIHGWAGDGWDPAGDRALTWGCLSLNKDDLLACYKEVKKGTPVVIVP